MTDAQQSNPEPGNIETQIASADLLNPADALDLLAQVASHDIDEPDSGPASRGSLRDGISSDMRHGGSVQMPYYPPVSDGYLTSADAVRLVHLYYERYHPYFPIASRDIFGSDDILVLAQKEPHLLTAVLTVASKDEPSWSQAHTVCSTHMESLISKLICRGSNSVGAVEALLILAEWAPQRLQSKPTIGKGEEDQGSWMQVGCAVRLGYLQRLEQTGLQPMPKDEAAVNHLLARKRLVWAACYISDRQISIRVGKGFWSRGPGPSILLQADDFPSLKSQPAGSDNLAMLFQAHLELTQLFGNSHEILYSSTSHREHLYSGGEYVRYIDDFNTTLRKWKLVWGSLSFTPHIKATLILSYDFLRLYINAFAFQATINRAVSRARQNSNAGIDTGSLFSDVASMPDARFIYESIDAANSLLGTLNSFIDPITGLRFMPLKYYLYVIYAAVFLFKARLAGAIGAEASASVRRAINATMDRLRSSAVSPHSPGHRYARLLYLLWRKPKDGSAPARETGGGASMGLAGGMEGGKMEPGMAGTDHLMVPSVRGVDMQVGLDTLNGFSWRDLDAVGQFITNDASLSDSMLESPSFASEQAGANMEFTTEWYDSLWSGNDVVF
ncbi:hypothetical protein GQ53DRAFT_742580 [Thozetella sp. PMI_491]|nr:hypothetical protein GQ53DRAFT_742580 [Thozetella sp. PMI_491]